MQLPEYQCHKRVRAARIGAIQPKNDGACLDFVFDKPVKAGEAIDDSISCVAVDVSQAWLDRFKPEVGGYYVVYDDGYASFSPAKAFEGGYTQIPVAKSAETALAVRREEEVLP